MKSFEDHYIKIKQHPDVTETQILDLIDKKVTTTYKLNRELLLTVIENYETKVVITDTEYLLTEEGKKL